MIYNGITDEGIKAIDSALELSAYEHKKLAQHQKLSSLADEDLAYTIRKNVNYLYIDYHLEYNHFHILCIKHNLFLQSMMNNALLHYMINILCFHFHN